MQDAGEDSDAKLVDYSILYDHTVRATLWREVSQKLKTCVSLGVLPHCPLKFFGAERGGTNHERFLAKCRKYVFTRKSFLRVELSLSLLT